MDDPFAPKKRFSLGRVLTGLVLLGTGTFAIAFYFPLLEAHSALVREHESLSAQQANLGSQLKLTSEQLEATQKERESLRTQLSKKDDAQAERERAAGSLMHALSSALEPRIKRKALKVVQQGLDTVVQIDNAKLYRGNQASVHPPGSAVLCDIAKALTGADAQLQVIAYSTSAQVDNALLRRSFATTVELTAARAASAALAITSCGLDPKRVVASGVGHHRTLDGAEANSDGQIGIVVSLPGES
jgi:flagellar motor protein MotB